MRKLAWFAVFFAAAALFVLWFPAERQGVLWIAPAAALAALTISLFPKWRNRKWNLFLRTALLGFGLGCLYVMLWLQVTGREMETLLDREQTVEAVVLEDSAEASYGLRTDVRIGRLRCCLYTDRSSPLYAGEKIRVRAEFRSTAEKTNSDYYLTLGVPLFGYARSEPSVLGMAEASWRFLPARIGRDLRERIRSLYDRNSAPFLLAILTGDRSELRDDTHFYAMLRTSGVSHCVAVSGMHLSFLVMFLYVLLGRGRISSLVCIPVTIAFMAMTGFTASVVRAGIMQIAVCGAALFRKEYDSLSAMGLALLILLLLNPYSIRNAGLLLSFSSTLGILLFCRQIWDFLPDPPKSWGKHNVFARLWYAVRASFSVSLSSSVFTVPLNAVFFGQISLFAPLTNLAVLWAVSLCFAAGLLGVLVSLFSLPAGMLFRLPVSLLVSYIRAVTGWIGRIPVAALYTRSVYLPCWLALTWISMGLYRFLPGLRRRALSFTVTAFASLLLFLGFSYAEPTLDTLRFCALDVGQGQCLVMTGASGTTLIDCGGSLYTCAGDIAAEYLFSVGRFQADRLILTHFHLDHVNGVEELLRRMPVRTMYCPKPEETDTDAWALLDFASARGTSVVFVENEILWMEHKGLTMALVPPLNREKENESGLCITASQGDFSLLCTGDAGSGTELRLLDRMQIEGLSVLIAGHHGSSRSVSEKLLEAADPKAVIISVGRNSYGLPAEQTLERIRNQGASIYRTDEQGNILLRYRRGGAIWAN